MTDMEFEGRIFFRVRDAECSYNYVPCSVNEKEAFIAHMTQSGATDIQQIEPLEFLAAIMVYNIGWLDVLPYLEKRRAPDAEKLAKERDQLAARVAELEKAAKASPISEQS